jgi:hypothetical protein
MDEGYSQAEIEEAITRSNAIAPMKARDGLDADPELAAEALRLGRATGVPARFIHDNMDDFKQEHKQSLVNQLLENNEQLATYVRENPLGAAVSNDDYGNLDNFTRNAQGVMALFNYVNPIRSFIRGTSEAFVKAGTVPLAEAIEKTGSPVVGTVLAVPIQLMGMAMAPVGGAQEVVRRIGKVVGAESEGEQLARDIGGVVESEMGRAGEHGVAEHAAEFNYVNQLRQAQAFEDAGVANTAGINQGLVAHPAKPWIDSGVEPPRGVSPETDKFKVEFNTAAVEELDANLDAALDVITRERDPESAKKYFQQHYENTSIGLSADSVAALYGDKVPTPDDGIFGWVPGIEEQLDAARTLGNDVNIPLADWMAKVDPSVAKNLRDDIRVWPGGITKNEAAVEVPPVISVDGPLAQIRAVSGTEPLFGPIGDKKLALNKLTEDGTFHEFEFTNEAGKRVGELTIMPDPENKTLWVANINGLAGLYSNSFGFSLIRDLKRQLKEFYPEYEFAQGHRVSEARGKAGTQYDDEVSMPRIKLGPEGWGNVEIETELTNFRKMFEEKFKDSITEDESKKYTIIPTPEGDAMYLGHDLGVPRLEPLGQSRPFREVLEEKYVAAEADNDPLLSVAAKTIAEVMDRNGLSKLPTYESAHPDSYFKGYGGIYNLKQPSILIRAHSPVHDLKIGIHEGAHALFHSAIENNPEIKATIGEMMDFVEKEFPRAVERGLDFYGMETEHEFVSEAFSNPTFQKILASIEVPKEWLEAKGIRFGDGIKTVWDWFLNTVRDAFGMKDPEDRTVLDAIMKYGEQLEAKVGGKEKGGPLFGPKEIQEKLDNLRAGGAGLSVNTFKKMEAALLDRHKEDLVAALKRAEKSQKRTQTKEWKEKTAAMKKEVGSTIRQQPVVMADMMIGSGEIMGEKLRQVYPLRAEDLTEAQRAGLPRRYYSADGLPADAVANMFGYPSGEAMVDHLIEYNQTRGEMSSAKHLDWHIEQETARQMEAMHGALDANIMQEAIDQALSETNLNYVLEEWQGAAMEAGVSVIDKDTAKEFALEKFAGMWVGDVHVPKLMSQMLTHYRTAVDAMAKGDMDTALLSLQKRYQTMVVAAEAKKLEKVQAKFAKTAKQFKKRNLDGYDQEYTNFIHDILLRSGQKIRPSAYDVAARIEAGEHKTLEKFVAAKTAAQRELPVWDALFDPNWKGEVERLTTEDFKALADSVKSLAWHAKDERKIYKQGEAAALEEVKKGLIEAIEKSVDGEVRSPKKPGVLKNYYVGSLQMENIFNRWDGFDSKGLWNQYVIRDLIEGANQEDAWKKEYAVKIKELPALEGLDRTIDNPLFVDKDTQTPLQFTRRNLITVMLNMGTGVGRKSNLYKLAAGHNVDMDAVAAWVHSHATAEDWKFVRGVWDVFEDIKKKADVMYGNLSGGVAPENIPTYPIQTPFGEVKGGYYPVIMHGEMEGKTSISLESGPLEDNSYVRATTANGYTKSRVVGNVGPLALDMDMMPGRIGQMLHDIAMRPAVINASKVFYDEGVRSAIRKHYGDEYRDQMIPYLKAVANSMNDQSKAQRAANMWTEKLRQNVIFSLVGLNPGTVLKHAPTALVTSMREVSGKEFAKAVHGMFRVDERTGESNWQFAMKNSLELQRRDRNWEETLYGSSTGALLPGDRYGALRQKVIEWSAKPVAISDMISAVPTWIAAYEKEMRETGVHGNAVYEADRAVRRAHGSTAITNRTRVMREWNPWLTSVYNFFSDIMNRQMETIWKAGEVKGLVKEGEKAAAMKSVGAITASVFAYIIWPAMVEHMVSGEGSEEKEPWAKTAGKAILRAEASSWAGVRDMANWLLTGHDPQFGLTGTAMKEVGGVVTDLKKDHPFRKDHAGRIIQDSAAMVGALTGLVPLAVGKAARYVHDVNARIEHPKGYWEWATGLRYGTTKGHTTSWEDYKRGKVRK